MTLTSQDDTLDTSQLRAEILHSTASTENLQVKPSRDEWSLGSQKTSRPTIPSAPRGHGSVAPHAVKMPFIREDMAPKHNAASDKTSELPSHFQMIDVSQGDTQPASPWVYEKCDEFYRNNGEATGEDHDTMLLEEYELGRSDTANVVNGFEQDATLRPSQIPAEYGHGDTQDDLDRLSQEIRDEVLGREASMKQIKTPAVESLKRKRGVVPHDIQDPETPFVKANPFAAMSSSATARLLSSGELFKNTQALTSPPMPDSMVMTQRPSPPLPYLHHFDAPPVSSPSSAVKPFPQFQARVAASPQKKHTFLRESQEHRDRILKRLEARMPARPADELSDDELGTVDRPVLDQMKQRKACETVKPQFAGFTSHSQPSTIKRPKTCRPTVHSSPTTTNVRTEAPLIISDASSQAAPDDHSEAETEMEDELSQRIEDPVVCAEENKENIEVPMTTSRSHRVPPGTRHPQALPSGRRPRSRPSSPLAQKHTPILLDTSSPALHRSSPRYPKPSKSSQQDVAIADSQSSSQKDRRSHLPKMPGANSNVPISSPCVNEHLMVPQSQEPTAKENSATTCSSSLSKSTPQSTFELYPQKVNPHDQHETRQASILPIKPLEHRPRDPPELSPSEQIRSHPGRLITPISDPAEAPMDNLQEGATGRDPEAQKELNSNVLIESDGSPSHPPSNSDPLKALADILAESGPKPAAEEPDVNINLLTEEDIQFQELLGSSGPPIPASRVRRRPHQAPPEVAIRQDSTSLNIQTTADHKNTEPRVSICEKHPALAALKRTPERPTSSAISIITPPASSQEHTSAGRLAKLSRNSFQPRLVPETLKSPTHRGAKHQNEAVSGLDPDFEGPKSCSSRDTSLQALAATVSDSDVAKKEPRCESAALPIVAPERCLAHFNSTMSAFYPASCFAVTSAAEPRYHVIFSDGAECEVNANAIKRLELCPGDVCKLDKPGERQRNFVILEVSDRLPTPKKLKGGVVAATDIFGHQSVLLAAKQREAGNEPPSTEAVGKSFKVSLNDIYITNTQWAAYKDRDFTYEPRSADITSSDNPAVKDQTIITPISSSRSRRVKLGTEAICRDPEPVHVSSRLFNNMAFVLTSAGQDTSLERMSAIISQQGGRVLGDGFESLFHVPLLQNAADLSTSARRDKLDNEDEEAQAEADANAECSSADRISLNDIGRQVGFTALISDKHCRKAKYIQALALGIPCLSKRWIHDCVAHGTLVSIAPYILPAGQSSYLDGAVRSRVLDPLPDPKQDSLADLIAQRPQFLLGTSILLIMSKQQESAMRHHNFLTNALGAARIVRVHNAEEVPALLKTTHAEADAKIEFKIESESRSSHSRRKSSSRADSSTRSSTTSPEQSASQSWDWIYTHDKIDTVKAIISKLSKTSKPSKPSKTSTKRTTKPVSVNHKSGSKSVQNIESDPQTLNGARGMNAPNSTLVDRIVDNEYIVQSLILGALIDPAPSK